MADEAQAKETAAQARDRLQAENDELKAVNGQLSMENAELRQAYALSVSTPEPQVVQPAPVESSEDFGKV